ncbi:hypothetical protein VNO77_22539 [Canavalia gladiata]|uniref:Uncharacterized protein n=1 Tax=Canavalia gladiata TaxID=3824 RepID=A0AAN9L803_CANGL
MQKWEDKQRRNRKLFLGLDLVITAAAIGKHLQPSQSWFLGNHRAYSSEVSSTYVHFMMPVGPPMKPYTMLPFAQSYWFCSEMKSARIDDELPKKTRAFRAREKEDETSLEFAAILDSKPRGFHATYAGYPDARKDRSSLLYTTPIKTCDESNQRLGRVYAEIATSKSSNLGRDERPFKTSIETVNPHPDCR